MIQNGEKRTNEIILSGRKVEYTLERKNVKNVNLRVKTDGSIYVSANRRVSQSRIEAFMRSKETLICGALDKYAQFAANKANVRSCASGEIFRVLGADMELAVEQGNKNKVHSEGSRIVLCVKNTDDIELKKNTINDWLDRLCAETLSEICTAIYPAFEKIGIEYPQLKYRKMKTRWGSCQPGKGIVTFNKRLIKFPRRCIEYVAMHEFSHFVHPNHSKQFYAFLTKVMPDWQQRKAALAEAQKEEWQI